MTVRTILLFAVLLSLGSTSLAVAQDADPPTPATDSAALAWGPRFVDLDGDGICDRHQVDLGPIVGEPGCGRGQGYALGGGQGVGRGGRGRGGGRRRGRR